MKNLQKDYDYIIIGSGFGGAVSALRLAEKGYRVLVIEKGKRYRKDDFPKTNWNIRKWLWIPLLKCFGIQKLTFFRHASILSGVGVGGGSLVYANTLPKPKTPFYNHGSWAALNDWETELAPYYELAWKMLGADVTPFQGEGDKALEQYARQLGKEADFAPTKVAVFFGEPDVEVADPYFDGKGPSRVGCTACGACMTGCRVGAKNTLDKNYLYLAEKLGVTILPEREVVDVIPLGENGKDGYEVVIKDSTKWFSAKEKITTKGVVFSGGVLGTVPLLLKLKSTSLPNLSDTVGAMVRTNNEALIVDVSTDENRDFSTGVAIGSILKMDKDSHLEPVRYGSGSGFWRMGMMPMVSEPVFWKRMLKLLITPLRRPLLWWKTITVRNFARHSSILLFMQHLDSTLRFRRGLFGMKSSMEKGRAPTAFIPAAHRAAREYGKIINAQPMVLFTETLTGIPSTAHILGGAVMGKNRDEGVIDSQNRVFGYENMYVFDGSMISANPGVNPALTITALTERGMDLVGDGTRI